MRLYGENIATDHAKNVSFPLPKSPNFVKEKSQ